MTWRDFFNEVLLAFPEMQMTFAKDELEHYNMERFADFTIEKINLSDWQTVERIFVFLEYHIKFVDSRIENALNVSYCEALLLNTNTVINKIVSVYSGPVFLNFYTAYEKNYKTLYTKSQKRKNF